MPNTPSSLPAQQSSTVVATRALVMIVALVGLPLCALLNAPLKGVVTGLLSGGQGEEAADNGADRPSHGPTAPGDYSLSHRDADGPPLAWSVSSHEPDGSRGASGRRRPDGIEVPLAGPPHAPQEERSPLGRPASLDPLVEAPGRAWPSTGLTSDPDAIYARPAPRYGREAPGLTTGPHASADRRGSGTPAAPDAFGDSPLRRTSGPGYAAENGPPDRTNLSPSSIPTGAGHTPARFSAPRSPNQGPPAAVPPLDPTALVSREDFEPIETRLRQLGAIYYRLEFWQGEEANFRFSCQVAIDEEHPNYRRPFEATETSPMAAMRRVLHDIERWRNARGPGARR